MTNSLSRSGKAKRPAVHSVLLKQFMEGRSADPELLGGVADIPQCARQRFQQKLALDLVACLLEATGFLSRDVGGVKAEIRGANELASRHDRRPLDDVFQLPDVARP